MENEPVKILLVEDNVDQRELTLRAFQKKEPDIRITPVETGPACLEALGKGRFDAVILDYSLPMMNGIEVLSEIQTKGYTAPVIMVTGQGDEKIAVEAMKRGACDYIIKSQNYHQTLPPAARKVIDQNRLKRRLEKNAQRVHRLYELSLSLATERKTTVLSDTLVEGAKELMDAEGALLFLIDAEQGEILQTAFAGVSFEGGIPQGPLSKLGLFGLACQEKRPILIEDPQKHPLKGATPALQTPLRQIFSIPLVREARNLGVLNLINQKQGSFSSEDRDFLSTLCVNAAVALDNARFLEEVEKRAATDSLTGLYNHREFQKRLGEETERASRYGKAFSLLMLDIDHFKVFNDTHGHPVGDAILKEIVKVIQKCIRNVDFPARYGGEEFSVILPETIGIHAAKVAERIRKAIDDGPFVTPTGHRVHLSISIGVASFPEDGRRREELILSADQALYFAKKDGRNRVCRYCDTLKAAIEKDQNKLTELLRNPEIKTIRDLAAVIDAKSPYTRGHSEGVIEYALLLADALNLGEQEKQSLQLASLLHNIGIVSIPDSILNKPGPLSTEERKIIQAHPGLAQMLIKESHNLDSVLPAILYHHERYDGKGYPNGLTGEEIPFLARVLGVVEAYHAMISVRPYRPKMSHEEAVQELRKNAGTQFDPGVVKTFLEILDKRNPA
ncbi:diguanylate cyclase [Candidatus Manganitrophus noduliformans]|nr:diguanylate cyclase [Candidatus Manganitrophus noduliformans]